MSFRTVPEYETKQRKRVAHLIAEGVQGITVRDTRPNTANPLEKEAEAMYFKAQREFIKTTFVRDIMDIEQDIYTEECNGKRL